MRQLVLELDDLTRAKRVNELLLMLGLTLPCIVFVLAFDRGWLLFVLLCCAYVIWFQRMRATAWLKVRYAVNKDGMEVSVPGRATVVQRWDELLSVSQGGRRLRFSGGCAIVLEPLIVEEVDLDAIAEFLPPDSLYSRTRRGYEGMRETSLSLRHRVATLICIGVFTTAFVMLFSPRLVLPWYGKAIALLVLLISCAWGAFLAWRLRHPPKERNHRAVH